MNLLTYGLFGWTLLLASCVAVAALANGRPPRNSKPIEAIVESLEDSGYTVVEVEIDSGHWEVDVLKGSDIYELHIDPVSGDILSKNADGAEPAPPANSIKLSQILKGIKQDGFSPITSIEFKRGQWQVEAYENRAKRELTIDAKQGKILSNRADD